MLFLLCRAGAHHFGIDVKDVIEVLPRVRFQTAAGMPPWLAGFFAHNGRPTPVIDLPFLVCGKACLTLWSSRILLVALETDEGTQRVGLLLEHVETAQLARPPEECRMPAPGLPDWGPVLLHEGQLVQFLELSSLLAQEQTHALLAGADRAEDA